MKFFALWMFTHDQADDLMVQSVERGRAGAGEGMSGGADAFTDGFMAMVAEEKARLKEQIASGKADEAVSPADERLDEVRFEVAELRGSTRADADDARRHGGARRRHGSVSPRVRALKADHAHASGRGARRRRSARVSGSHRRQRRRAAFAIEWRRAFEKLGGAFIKLGQMISVRPDEFGDELAGEMECLCDRVAAVPFSQLRPVIEESLGAPVSSLYASIDEAPLATASVAQVHAAVLAAPYRPVWGEELPAGAEVVVKVIRPGAADALRSDIVEARRLAGSALARLLVRGIDLGCDAR